MEFANQVFASCIGSLLAYLFVQMYQVHMLQKVRSMRDENFSEYVEPLQ